MREKNTNWYQVENNSYVKAVQLLTELQDRSELPDRLVKTHLSVVVIHWAIFYLAHI